MNNSKFCHVLSNSTLTLLHEENEELMLTGGDIALCVVSTVCLV